MTNQDLAAEDGNYKWKALITTAMGALMATMDFSITNIAFPTLTKVFNKDITTVIWVTVAYVLVSTSSMLILGKISDIVGRKKIYSIGMLVFTLGMAACAFAESVGELIFYRSFQGLGAAMTVSCGTAIVAEAFPLKETGRGLGLLGISVSLGFIIGPVLGGFLLDWLDWRAIFYVRAPVSFLALILGLILLKKDRTAARSLKLDLLGALTSSLGIFCLVYGISQVRTSGLLSPTILLWVGCGVVTLSLFAVQERRTEDPLLDLSLFKNRTFRKASLCLFFSFVSAPPFILIMPFYLMQGIGMQPSEAGLLLAVNSVATIVCGPVSGALSDRFGAQRFAAAGAAATASAFVLMMFFDLDTGMAAIISVLILLGMGIGMFQTPNSSMIMGSVPRNRLGTASALMATLRQVGISLGMALSGALYASRLMHYESEWITHGTERSEAVRLSIPVAFHDTLLFSIILGAVVVLLSFPLRGEESRRSS
jgi:EmrB/QacA subfamily drug resistance transporter